MKQMDLKLRTHLQTLLVVLFAALALFGAFLTVLSLIPEADGLTVRETVTVTASRVNADGAEWQLEARGRLRNTADKTIRVERITLTVKGSATATLELTEPFTLAPRADYDLILVGTAPHATEGRPEITATVDGDEVYLRNPAETPLAATLIPLALTVLFAILTLRAVKTRRYLAEEARL